MTAAKAMLLDATRQLQARWTETRAHWRDDQAVAFEERFITPLAADVSHALRVIDELDKLLQQIHADCE